MDRLAIYQEALASFDAKVHNLTTKAVCSRSYVRIVTLKEWMRAPSQNSDGTSKSNIELLERAAYYGKNTKKFLPIDPSAISTPNPEQCSLVVFCILLALRHGHLIDVFAQSGVLDKLLPIDLPTLSAKLAHERLQNSGDLLARFHAEQWRFCPVFFTRGMNQRFTENRIVPVCRDLLLSEGSTAKVWQIAVQAEFFLHDHGKVEKGREYTLYNDPQYGLCYYFARKTFDEPCHASYEMEKEAFDGLRHVPGMIKRLGSWSEQLPGTFTTSTEENVDNPRTTGKLTKNLLLEFGEFDLRHVLNARVPPAFPKTIIDFWEALFEVASAVSEIHEFEHGGNDFYGWHADIKPENIIEVGDKYKLADPGYAWFRKMEADDNGVKPLASLRGGTDTYGAPEVYRMYAHQTVDIWSLGCVFSMAATWIVLGFPGVNQYGSLRAKGIASILKSAGDARRILLESQRLSAEPESIDCFHNGTKVLAEVTAWHGLLKNACRKHDTITAKVIDLIDQRMLLQDPEHRISARELRGKLKELLAPAKEALDESTNSETPEARTQRTRMERLLREIDQETGQNVGQDVEQLLPSPARSVMTGQPADRGLLKAQISHSLRRKVSHLFEPLPEPHGRRMSSELLVTYPAAVPVESRRTIETINVPKVQPLPSVSELAEMHMDGQNSPVGRSPRHSVNSRTGRRNTGMSLPPNRPAGHGVQNYENIIQAREKIERGKKIRKSSFGGFKIPKKMPAKDDFLGRYFQNRDIVFLVDNAESMTEHWDAATFVLETLVWKAVEQDPDGPDLVFTRHSAKLESEEDATRFREAMQNVVRLKKKEPHTDMKAALRPILNKYLQQFSTLARRHEQPKDLTIIVLTDGRWEGPNDGDALIAIIRTFYENLWNVMNGMPRRRQVSIQFIQFGDDPDASEKLRHLDDDDHEGLPDLIDCEQVSVRGNVFKMLLGSFVEEMDQEESTEVSSLAPDSPMSPRRG